MHKTTIGILAIAAGFAAGFGIRGVMPGETVAHAQAKPRVYELRTYTAVPGRLDALHARFKDHLLGFFQKHGMTNVVYFKPMDAPLSENTMMYLVSHESREAAAKSWSAFQNDAEWKKISSAGGGAMASKVESVFLVPTEYSPMK